MFGAETGMDERAWMGYFRLLEKTPDAFSFSLKGEEWVRAVEAIPGRRVEQRSQLIADRRDVRNESRCHEQVLLSDA